MVKDKAKNIELGTVEVHDRGAASNVMGYAEVLLTVTSLITHPNFMIRLINRDNHHNIE